MMKKIISILFFLTTFGGYAQGSLQLSLNWNEKFNRYEVFAKPNFSANNVFIGQVQITIVVPAEFPDDIFKITSTDVGVGFGLSQFIVLIPPLSVSMLDLHPLYSSFGPKVNFVKNQELLLFGFTFMDNQCREGLRLFENELDTNALPEEMQSYDFRNSILAINALTIQELYSSNYNNNGTICAVCIEKKVVPFTIQKSKSAY